MKLGQYKGIHAKRPNITVSEQDILKVLKNKQKEYSIVTNIDGRPAQTGDQAILDFDGFLNGQPIPGGKSRDYPLLLGSHTFVPGFEEQIVGRSTGDIFDICVTFPANYHLKQLSGKAVVFHTTLKQLRLPEYQPLDDDFAKDFSEHDTLTDWKEAIRENLTIRKETSAYERLSREILSAVIANCEFEIDEDIKSEITEELYDDFLYTLEENRMTLETYCQRSGFTKEDIISQKEQEAIRSIQEQSILHAVASKENLEVSSDELTEELCMIAAEEEEDIEDFRSSLGEEELDGISDQLRMNKALKFIMKHAILE